MSISREVALNSDAWWYCNWITESSLEGFLPVSKSLLLRMQSQQSGGGLWGRLCLISISKPLHCQLSEAAFPPVCAQVNVRNVWGWHHPPWESVVDTDGEGKQHKGSLILTPCIFYFFDRLAAKNPPHCLFTIRRRPQSCVEYNFKFRHSVWSYVLYFFPISSRCHECVCKIVLHWLCAQRGQSVCFAARL